MGNKNRCRRVVNIERREKENIKKREKERRELEEKKKKEIYDILREWADRISLPTVDYNDIDISDNINESA